MKNADMPAIPLPNTYEDALEIGDPGLTKREHFAAMAMQGMLSNSNTDEFRPIKGDSYYFLATMAIKQADALLAELENS